MTRDGVVFAGPESAARALALSLQGSMTKMHDEERAARHARSSRDEWFITQANALKKTIQEAGK